MCSLKKSLVNLLNWASGASEEKISGFLCVIDILEWKMRDSRAFLRQKQEQIKKVGPTCKPPPQLKKYTFAAEQKRTEYR